MYDTLTNINDLAAFDVLVLYNCAAAKSIHKPHKRTIPAEIGLKNNLPVNPNTGKTDATINQMV